MDKRTERERTLDHILERAGKKAEELAQRAVGNVAETGQSASFSVKARLEPDGEGQDVKVIVDGRITLSAGQEIEHMSLEDQVRAPVDPT